MLSPTSFSANNVALGLNIASSSSSNGAAERLSEQPRASISSPLPPNTLDSQNADNEDLQEKIAQAIDESLVHKIFSAISRNKQGAFADYDSNFNNKSNSKGETNEAHSQSSNTSSSNSSKQSLQLDIPTDSTVQVNINRHQLETRFSSQSNSLSLNIGNEEEIAPQSDPLILDLDFNGFEFSSISNNIQFDLNANGKSDSISNTQGKDAFLAIDLNSNGIIDDGSELFGDTRGAKDGFVDLARFDDNGDSIINAQDRVYDQLLLLTFTNNGKQSISSLKNSGVESISLNDSKLNQNLDNGNTLVSQAQFTTDSGQQGLIGDFLLATR